MDTTALQTDPRRARRERPGRDAKQDQIVPSGEMVRSVAFWVGLAPGNECGAKLYSTLPAAPGFPERAVDTSWRRVRLVEVRCQSANASEARRVLGAPGNDKPLFLLVCRCRPAVSFW